MGRSGRNRRSMKEKPLEKPGKLNEWADGWGDGLDDPSQYSSSGRNRRSTKKKPGKLNEWADGWGDGLDDPNNGQPKPHFSLGAEAQNTGRRQQQQRSSTPRISREPVQFISVGQMNLDQSFKKLEVETPSTLPINLCGITHGELTSELNVQELQPAQSTESISSRVQEAGIVPDADAGGKTGHTSGATRSEVNSGLFSTDTMGTQKSIHTAFAQPVIRPISPCLSDSSDEVIVFAGRGTARGAHLVHRTFSQNGDRSLQGAHSTTSQGVNIREDPVDVYALVDSRDTGSTGAVLEALDGLNHNTRGKKPKQTQLEALALEEEAIADYIANIDPTDSPPNTTNLARNLGNEYGNETDNTGELRDNATIISPQQSDSHKELKTSGDLVGLKVAEILSKRHNLSDIQYLVVDEGSSADFLKSASAGHPTRTFESEPLKYEAGSTRSDDSGSGGRQGPMAADVQDALNDATDKKDAWDRQVEGMTDEKIARLLSKQEELGLGSSELLLVDGFDADEEDDGDGVEFVVSGKDTISSARPDGNMINQSGNNLPYPNPIPEESDAKYYGDYDIMDLDRPSLGRLPKGRSRVAALGLNDDNTATRMEVLWENDRSKKKIRKQEREELRAQGLLGPKSKDSATMSSDDIKSAIREFLVSSATSLSLPPMGPKDRKMVHEIAHGLRLKSRSFGDDGARYPVLVKTDEVSFYDERVVDALERRYGFRARKDKGPRYQESKSRNPRGVGEMSRFTYQDGDIVGAAAPELGVENKGRAMLEKMGWSKGTALGALNNKGIMQPLVHVVRNSKAGLG